jgi:hypothetical protein
VVSICQHSNSPCRLRNCTSLLPHLDWRAAAAYIYILHLDSMSLAWEYLRRNRAYRRDWVRLGRDDRGRPAHKWRLQSCRESGARFP